MLKIPIVEGVSKSLDKMVAHSLIDRIRGLSFLRGPPSSPCLTNHSRWISVFDAELSVHYMPNSFTPREAYHFHSDAAGDHICIFGFSRGAFTARALVGLLDKVGLLPPYNLEQLPFAYQMYARDDDVGRKSCLRFKQTCSIDVRIKFFGVWYVIRPTDPSPVSYISM